MEFSSLPSFSLAPAAHPSLLPQSLPQQLLLWPQLPPPHTQITGTVSLPPPLPLQPDLSGSHSNADMNN